SYPDPMHPKKEILLYNGSSGEVMARIPADGYLPDSKFVWLSPNSLAFTTYNRTWLVFEQSTDGTWIQTQTIQRFTEDDLDNLTVISPHAIAWQQEGDVWT